jgi:hypothetical protein
MSQESTNPIENANLKALSELEQLISARYPDTVFEVGRGGDEPDGLYLTAIVDLDDPDEVMDLVIDRLLSFQVDEGLAIQVVPVRTQARVAAELARRSSYSHLPATPVSVQPSP